MLFEVISKLKVNLSKSVLIPVGDVPELAHLAHFLSCGVEYLPSYLGLPLDATYKSNTVWEPVVERFRKRLAEVERKSKLLSRGRLTLLKSTLWSLPTYFMSLFSCYHSLSLKENHERFSLVRYDSTNGLHWVNWGKGFHPKQEGDLLKRRMCFGER